MSKCVEGGPPQHLTRLPVSDCMARCQKPLGRCILARLSRIRLLIDFDSTDLVLINCLHTVLSPICRLYGGHKHGHVQAEKDTSRFLNNGMAWNCFSTEQIMPLVYKLATCDPLLRGKATCPSCVRLNSGNKHTNPAFWCLLFYHPLVASFSSPFRPSQLIPTMASPSPVLHSARTFGSLKWVVAWTMALAR